jgi:hydroxyethylthiazole kinase-like uncharacterized protein yjeF
MITMDEHIRNCDRLTHIKSIVVTAVLFLVMLIGSAACAGETAPSTATNDTVLVAASIAPLADFARQVGSDHVQVITLVPPGASPHTYELTPAQVEQTAKAHLLVLNGVGLEYWADKLIQSADNPNLIVVDTSQGIEILGRDAGELGGNPHIWLDPQNAIIQVEQIRQALLQADPAYGGDYRANAERYIAELEALDQEIANEVATWSSRQFIAFHPAWAYFARRYGLKQAAVIERSPGREPSPAEVAQVVETARRIGAKAIFAEPQFSSRAAQTIAEESDAEVLFLDPLGASLDDPSYLDLMHYNLAQMAKALQGTHQGDFGEVLFIAGAASYFGPPYFAALSFLKAGGRCARLAAPKSMVPFLAGKAAEIALSPQKETVLGSISFENKRALLELSKRADMVVLGPGLGLEEETHQLARDLAAEINKPLLIDGDGIAAVWADLNIIRQRKAETILTLHPGEMSKITGMCVGDIDTQKINGLQRITANLGAVIVLKGAHSLVGYPDERVFINLSGNRGMATAGVDELLTGTIIAMFGLGLPLQHAVRQGVFIHGLAGDLAAAEKGEDGITAQDILDYLPLALKVYREGLNEPLRERYAGMHII